MEGMERREYIQDVFRGKHQQDIGDERQGILRMTWATEGV